MAQTAGNAVLNAATLAFNVAIALLLSRLLGVDGYGAYAFAIAWGVLFTVPASLGLPKIIVREIARYGVREDWSRTSGLLSWGHRAALVASLMISGAAAAVFVALGWPQGELFEPTLIGLAVVPAIVLIRFRQAAMQGLGVVVLAQVPEKIVAPIIVIALALALETMLPGGLSASAAVGAQVAAAIVAALIGGYLLRRTVSDVVRRARSIHETRAWLMGAAPILLAAGIGAVNLQAGIILTGAMAGSEEAGIYGVASRVAALLSFLLLAGTPSLMPAIAELHERGELQALQRMLTVAARVVFLGSLPVAVTVIFFARPVLDLFGLESGAGVTALQILSVGQLVNIATGFAGTILVMIGESGQATWAVAAGTATNLLLSVALIPRFGATGAAVGTSASIAVANVLMVYLLWRRQGLNSAMLCIGRANGR